MESRPTWRKTRHSGSDGGHCVELARLPGGVGIRDPKNPEGPRLLITRDALRALVSDLKR
ncbi:DUF397 domain-containing protein [Actinomadura decatromicini]|uniref:DUF397 domain-containing protein n=2 Tax=Actinomadura decatromicini TaxID=2604572 RepID=A0A5D3FSG4_9ACTN|nr:DUF397 domain-containing protein [Actinomadura decatromicini]TYK50680.1 DUF397 domain-containing protein [Actinomadura decatromicini]